MTWEGAEYGPPVFIAGWQKGFNRKGREVRRKVRKEKHW